jgi:adenosylhomocysteine nucleosidase
VARLGVITGLVSELNCLAVFAAADRPRARCAGIGAVAAREASRALIAEGCTGILSFGMAGGLDPALKAGTVVIADRIVTADGRFFATQESWRKSLVEVLAGIGNLVSVASIAGSERVVTSVAAKQNLRRHTGAVVVDMESVGVAEAAAEAGLPFMAVRAVADTAWFSVPEGVLGGVGADGALRPLVVAVGLLARPWAVPVVAGLARDSRRARAGLRRVAALSGPRFGFG